MRALGWLSYPCGLVSRARTIHGATKDMSCHMLNRDTRLHDGHERSSSGNNPKRTNLVASLSCVSEFCVLMVLFAGSLGFAQTRTVLSSPSGLTATLDAATGNYCVRAKDPQWVFCGTLTSAASAVSKVDGQDRVGHFQQVTFTWQHGGVPLQSVIRLYQHRPLLLFGYKYLKATSPVSVAFPSFTTIPERLYHFSYKNGPFAAPQFSLGQYGTPWLFFDGKADAVIISPASHFIIASMRGDGDRLIASGLNDQLSGVPSGFDQQTLMAIAPGIRHTFNIWGSALIALGNKTRPGNESDDTLKYFGYWTDNGAAYYYRFIPALGYAGTLEAVIRRYREEKIPVRYLQLDSWWYDKSFPGMKSSDQVGSWKGYGGIMRYHADASLFPHGLGAFQKKVDLPLVVHSRWISKYSPYHNQYDISGIAPVGARWWSNITGYLAANGVVTYEQDWQSRITPDSPAFSSTVNTGDDFYNHMANSCRAHHLTMQYCMALPSDFLEGSRYDNLTTIRASNDRFSRPRWRDFLYTSQLAYAIGSWPWTDVYFSRETNNMLIDTLSAGPVGTGDALGAEDKHNIMMAVRSDGVIVKPDVPLMPLDQMYVDDAKAVASSALGRKPMGETPSRGGAPFISDTWTDDGLIRTGYVFAFSRSPAVYQTVQFTPGEIGIHSPVYVYGYFSHLISRVPDGGRFQAFIGPGGTSYYVVAPVGPSGIALFGDKGKFVSMGKERIASIEEDAHSVTARVLFAAGDGPVTLFGIAPSAPSVVVHGGSSSAVVFHKGDGYFSVRVVPKAGAPTVEDNGDPVRSVSVAIGLPAKVSESTTPLHQ